MDNSIKRRTYAPFYIIQKIYPAREYLPGSFGTFREALAFKKSMETAYPKSRFRVLQCRAIYPDSKEQG